MVKEADGGYQLCPWDQLHEEGLQLSSLTHFKGFQEIASDVDSVTD